MSEISFTESQTAAINVTAPKILISAAAGSGKSTVLTERIISSVTSEEKAFDISRILAVTFTKASAEDLKAKISKAVRNAVLNDPKNNRLKSQLIKLSSAKISTIHGLCLSLIKSHFQMLGLSASMRVADEVESSALRAEVLEELLEEAYAGYFAPIPDFAYFVENFVTERDDSLNKLLTGAYDKIKNIPNGFDEWEKKISGITEDRAFAETGYGKLILFHFSLFLDYAELLLSNTVKKLSEDVNYADKYLPSFSYDLDFIITLKASANNGDFNKISSVLADYSPVKLKPVSSALKTEYGEYARTSVKDYLKKKIKDFKVRFFSATDGELRESGNKTAKIAKELILFLKEFDTRFTNLKRRFSVLDFNDLEHYTLKLLYNADGTVSDTAKRISDSLDEIYVDEYQDVNPLQNKIFEALSVSCPIFMVGDIKQSIYSFRGADPSIFSDCRRSFDGHVPGKDVYQGNVTVFLSDNFRSAFNVTEFVNAVSEPLFSTPFKEERYSYRIPYSTADRLVCNVNTEAPKVSLMIAEEFTVPDDGEETEDVSPAKGNSACRLEAEMVANKISELISGGVRSEDIAILLRGTKTDAPIFEAALKKRNIPISTDKGASLFDTPEVQLSLCLLNCIDNPYRDIFLAGALRSPVFGFTLDDLIRIRRFGAEGTALFDALKEYTFLGNFKKGLLFLEFLSRMRAFSCRNTIDRTLWQIYTETAFFTLIYDGGTASGSLSDARRANLLKLHGLAKSFASSGKSDLFSFIEYVRTMMTADNTPSAASIHGDGVKIMSIHHSKGLEFDHCFVARTSRTFSTESHKSSVVIEDGYGIAMRLKDELRLTSADTVYRQALLMQNDLSETEEEMRLLYVALSRAKKALYISGTVKDLYTLETACLHSASTPHPMLFASQKSYLKWILTALKCKTDLAPDYERYVKTATEIYGESKYRILPDQVLKKAVTPTEGDDRAYDVLKTRFDYIYPYEKTAFIPSKLSVSKLYPDILDSLETEAVSFGDGEEFFLPDLETLINEDNILSSSEFSEKADFSDLDSETLDAASTQNIESDTPDNSSKMKTPSFLLDAQEVTAAEKGIATHVFMQFCDFENTEKNGIDAEITRLTEKRFLHPAHAEMIDKKTVKAFFDSDIYVKIKNAVSLQREYRFNIKLPAADFTTNPSLKEQIKDDHVFVQGVIDCYFKDRDGSIFLLDYKTDRVPREIRGNKEKENNFFINRHSRQLEYYKKALEKLTGKKVSGTVIYSFALGRTVDIE